MKVIFICHQPLSVQLEKKIWFDFLSAANIEVRYFDITELYHPQIDYSNSIEREYVVRFSDWTTFEKLISSHSSHENIFIPLLTYSFNVIKPFRILTKYQCTLAFIAQGNFPMPANKFSIRTLVKLINPFEVFNYFLEEIQYAIAKYLKIVGFIKPYDIIFESGEGNISQIGVGYGIDQNRIDKGESAHIKINYCDYDNYLKIKYEEVKIVNSDYVVFLDEYFPFHQDFEMLGIKTVNPDRYYNSLDIFFTKLEKLFNVQVVIAAHPKADYKKNKYFLDREIYLNKTAELVKDSKFVLAHASTSSCYAIFFQKPIVFIYTKDFIEFWSGSYLKLIKHSAREYAANIYNVDEIEDENIIKILPINQTKYDYLKYRYFTAIAIETIESKDIVLRFLQNYQKIQT